jgi:hypothetical protein
MSSKRISDHTSALSSSPDKASAPSVRALDNFERLRNALDLVDDLNASLFTVGELLTIWKARHAFDGEPLWNDDADRWADALETILGTKAAAKAETIG